MLGLLRRRDQLGAASLCQLNTLPDSSRFDSSIWFRLVPFSTCFSFKGCACLPVLLLYLPFSAANTGEVTQLAKSQESDERSYCGHRYWPQ